MAISTFEGVVKNGQIQLHDNVTLPENCHVYVIILDFASIPQAHVRSPRLVHPSQAADFVKQVVEVADDAGL
jgi:hypothetical protein